MAPATLVLDASVVVKWFSKAGEEDLAKALEIRSLHIEEQSSIMVPDILYHEVGNALIHKQELSLEEVLSAVEFLFGLHMATVNISEDLLSGSVRLARQSGMSEYDACYAAVAMKYSCPLVTANPRHHRKAQQPGCRIIPLKEWRFNT